MTSGATERPAGAPSTAKPPTPMRPIRIGIIGDYNPEFVSHTTVASSLSHVAAALLTGIESAWIPTPAVPHDPVKAARYLEAWDGLWISAGSPYASREGALASIRVCRERGKPMVAT